MNTENKELLVSIDMIQESVNNSEINVLLSMNSMYVKQLEILEYCSGKSVNEMDIIQEAFFGKKNNDLSDDDSSDKSKFKRVLETVLKWLTTVLKILVAPFKMVGRLIKSVLSKAKNNKGEISDETVKFTKEEKKEFVYKATGQVIEPSEIDDAFNECLYDLTAGYDVSVKSEARDDDSKSRKAERLNAVPRVKKFLDSLKSKYNITTSFTKNGSWEIDMSLNKTITTAYDGISWSKHDKHVVSIKMSNGEITFPFKVDIKDITDFLDFINRAYDNIDNPQKLIEHMLPAEIRKYKEFFDNTRSSETHAVKIHFKTLCENLEELNAYDIEEMGNKISSICDKLKDIIKQLNSDKIDLNKGMLVFFKKDEITNMLEDFRFLNTGNSPYKIPLQYITSVIKCMTETVDAYVSFANEIKSIEKSDAEVYDSLNVIYNRTKKDYKGGTIYELFRK